MNQISSINYDYQLNKYIYNNYLLMPIFNVIL